MDRIKILLFASNPEIPSQRSDLKLDEEVHSIKEKIRSSEFRDVLELESIWAVRPDDLLQELNIHKPTIVHFSGHGNRDGEIALMDKNRQVKPVSSVALKTLFTTMKDNIRVVVLNACYTQIQATAIAEVVDCVIGMSKRIGDDAAITFAASFYRAIGFGRSVQEAFEQGKTALLLEGIPEEATPQLLVREGVDASKITLIEKVPRFLPLDRKLPEDFISRDNEMSRLKSLLTEQVARETIGITAIRGIGGVGKSILARQLSDEDDIREHFRGRIIADTMPTDPQSLIKTMQKIGEHLGDDIDKYTDHCSARTRLEEILQQHAVLIILDNVKNTQLIDRFIFRAPRCHLVITTRFASVVEHINEEVDHLNAEEVVLREFDEEEAIELLSRITKQRGIPEFTDIARCLGYHPLALQIAGKRIKKGMAASEWYRRYSENVHTLKFDAHSKDPEDNIAVSIGVSTDYLDESEKSLYHSLGIFPEHLQIPVALVLELWGELNLNYRTRLRESYHGSVFDDLLKELADLALIEYDKEYVTIHDLLHSYNKAKLGQETEMCHEALLKVLNPDDKEWYLLEEDVLTKYDHYICRFLPYHMEHAGQKNILRAQFRRGVHHLERNAVKRDLLREHLTTTIWHSLWNIDKTNENSVGTFLVKKWLPRRIPNPKSPYTFRIVAVRCAGEVGFNEGIALALCHPDKRISVAALNHVYSLSQYELKQALEILELASSRVVGRFWLPNARATGWVLMALFAVYGQFETSKGHGDDSDKMLRLLTEIIRTLTRKTVLRLLGPRSRILVSGLIYPFIRIRFVEAEAVSPNNLKGINAFFSQDWEKRNFAIQCLKYLDVNHGSPSDIQEIVPKLLLNPDNSPSDRISGLIAEGIIIAHGLTDFSRVEILLRKIASRDNGNCRAVFTATHSVYTIMTRKPDTITNSTLIMMKEFVTQWLETSKEFGYGRVKDEYGCYQVYPLAYYSALWMIARPGEEIDLLNDYALRALESNDENLQLHIAGMLGDTRCIMSNYPIVLKILKPYFRDIEANGPMWKMLVSGLGSIYSHHVNAVEELLDDVRAPIALREEIEAYSYQRPVSRIYMRVYQVFVEMLASNNARYMVDILERSLTAPNLRIFGVQSINQIISLLLDNTEVSKRAGS